ncbi:MAG: pyridoxal-5'-phosphate-dependent protein beta subunit [Methylococcus sp.]|nr:MAG: pyridoxal-5'-phosphate-dependent protein beta subunit [Methylococcus sp.]
MINLAEILQAADRIAGKIHRTPIFSSRTLGKCIGVELFLKCECFQKTGSFKPRGALNKVLTLSDSERHRGLITVSAGNHAQAVAWAANQIGARCTVVMPSDAPQSKVDAVKAYRGKIIFHEDRATLFDKLNEEKDRRGLTFVHPFDDPVVLAGAGTVGVELVEDCSDVDFVIVPVGGGGLMAGVVSAVKQMKPTAKVIAVELEAGPALKPAIEAGNPIHVDRPYGTLADGMTPPFIGQLPLEIARDNIDEIVTVTEGEIIATMKLLMTRAKICAEGAGAAATAALLYGKANVPAGSRTVALVSGGNVDLDKLVSVFGS